MRKIPGGVDIKMQVSQNSVNRVLHYQGRNYPLDKEQIVIGSDPRCDICIADKPRILPAHAVIISRQGQVFVQNLDHNTTMWINGAAAANARLQHQAEITIGDSSTKLYLLNWTPVSQTASTAQSLPKGSTTTNGTTSVTSDKQIAETKITESTGDTEDKHNPPPLTDIKHTETTDVKYTETTRYLCAAAHLNAPFRNYVIKHIVEEDHKAVGESFGADIVSIVRHCLAARQREILRDIALMLSLLVLIISGFRLWIPCLIAAYIIVYIELWSSHKVIVNQLTRGKFNPDAIDFKLDSTLEEKIKHIATQNSNLVVYSGSTPFVDAGISIGGWSFALNIQKGAQKAGETEALKPQSFQIKEMYRDLTDALMKLGVNGLSMMDKLYVDGREIRNDQRFLPTPFARPYAQVDPSLVETFIENSPQSIRHYKCIQVTSWKGEMVFFAFLRLSSMGRSLFVETNYFLLPPVKEEYSKIDSIQPALSIGKIGELLWPTVVTTLLYWVFSPFTLLRSLLRPLLHQNRLEASRKEIRANSLFDYGANSSVRVYASSSRYRQLFQRLDKEMYVKIIERQVLESIIDFLDRKNIDTTDLQEQRTMLANSGFIIPGGAINTEALTVGEQAKFSFNRMKRLAREKLLTSN
jgi:hypothetical protein